MFAIEQKVANTAKRAGLLSGGLLFCLVGAGFLTVAGWLALTPIIGAKLTALVIAGVYLGFGCIMIGLGTKSVGQDPVQTGKRPEADAAAPPIVQAFMFGLQAGSQAEQRRR
jgi:hypothetical protein